MVSQIITLPPPSLPSSLPLSSIDPPLQSTMDVQVLTQALVGNFMGVVQYNRDNTAFEVNNSTVSHTTVFIDATRTHFCWFSQQACYCTLTEGFSTRLNYTHPQSLCLSPSHGHTNTHTHAQGRPNNITLDDLCTIMSNSSILPVLDRFVAVNDLLLNSSGATTINASFQGQVDSMSQVDWDAPTNMGGQSSRCWKS